jgi:aminoglycoside phosphotransferase (APT) family kinase protein
MSALPSIDASPEVVAGLRTLLTAKWPGAHLSKLEPLDGGRSSLTFSAAVEAAPVDRIVAKQAVPNLPPTGNRDVLRQARLLAALRTDTDLPVPAVYAMSGADSDVPFFAMEFVPGESFEPILDERADAQIPAPEIIRARMLEAAGHLARLHAAPLRGEFANQPARTPAAEIGQWLRVFEVLDPALAGNFRGVYDALTTSAPESVAPQLLHGDFRLGNMICRGSEIVAILDWEIWACGDGRIDLAWLLQTVDPAMHPSAIRNCSGLPSPAEMLAQYEEASARTVESIEWFRAAALFKTAAVTGLLVRNARKRGTELENLVAEIPVGLARASQLLEEMSSREIDG